MGAAEVEELGVDAPAASASSASAIAAEVGSDMLDTGVRSSSEAMVDAIVESDQRDWFTGFGLLVMCMKK